MQRATRDQYAHAFDRHRNPVLNVAPGEVFEVETEDSRCGRTRTPETTTPQFLRAMRAKGYLGNPVTGPIRVAGALPGDTLAVEILNIECDTLGYAGYWPMLYHLDDWFSEPVTVLVQIKDGLVHYDLPTDSGTVPIRMPIKPMIGCIGTAAEIEVITTSTAGRQGGNLDVPEVGIGATIYLPVSVAGGWLYLGDCHPYQGDGEVAGCEMRSLVTLRAQVLKDWTKNMQWPRLETPDHLVTIGCDRPLESAQWLAIREMILWLEERFGWTKAQARLFINLASDLRPGQVQTGNYTMRLLVPKNQLPRK